MKKARLRFVVLGLLFVATIVFVSSVDGQAFTSPLPTPPSPLPTPTPPGGGGNGEGIDWLEWLLENMDRIVEVVLLIIALIVSWLGRGGAAERYGVSLMLEAEKLAKAAVLKTGSQKMEYVVGMLVRKLPADVKAVLVTVAAFRGMTLEELVEELAQRWYSKATETN